MGRTAWVSLAVVFFWGCVAHEKNGDRAASVGDWKTAYFEYREGVAKDPEDANLRTKFEQAKKEALVDAARRAHACAATQQWQCALGEAEFSLTVEPGDAQMARFRLDAASSLARQKLAEARSRAQARDFRAARVLLEEASRLGTQPELDSELAQAHSEVAQRASVEAERLRRQHAYPEAVELLTFAATVDPSRREQLEALRSEQEQFLEAEHERLANEGDAALAARDFGLAFERYNAAAALRPQGRASLMVHYTGNVQAGEAALAHRDYAASAQSFRQALETGQDRSGYAAERLRVVEPRPYSVRIRSVLALPQGGRGNPWGGRRGGGSQGQGRGGELARASMIALASQLPESEQMNLVIIVTQPDGRQMATPMRRALHATYDSRFTLWSNQLEDRGLSFRVIHREAGQDREVGLLDVPVRDLLSSRRSFWEGGGVAFLELQSEPVQGNPHAEILDMELLSSGPGMAHRP